MALTTVLLPTIHGPYLRDAVSSATAQGVPVLVEPDPQRTGQSATVNRAYAASDTPFVTVLHDDDYYVRPDAVAALEAVLTAHPDAAAVYSLPLYVQHDGTPIGTPDRLARWCRDHPVVTRDTAGLRFHGTGILYRREWWDRVGGWDESLPCCEEWEYHLRLLSAGAVFVGCPEVTVAYRRHPAQKSGRRVGTYGRRSLRRQEIRDLINARYAEVPCGAA